jgi:hypothetical protein
MGVNGERNGMATQRSRGIFVGVIIIDSMRRELNKIMSEVPQKRDSGVHDRQWMRADICCAKTDGAAWQAPVPGTWLDS